MTDLIRAGQLAELHRFSEAETLIRAHLTSVPDSGRALVMLAEVLVEQDRYPEAVTAAEQAVRAEPDDEHAHRLLAIALSHTSRHDEAVRAARESVRLNPGIWQTHYTLGMTLRCGRRPRTRDALAAANEAVRLAPHVSHPHNLAGLCLDDLRLPTEAMRAYREALRLDPGNATAINNVAASQLEGGRLAEASRMLTSGLNTAPQERTLHRNYDALLLRLVWRLYLALIALGVILTVLAAAEAPYPARVGTVVVLLAVYVAAVQVVTRNLPRGARLWARGLFRRITWIQRLLLGGFLLLSVAVAVIGFAPNEAAVLTAAATLVVLRAIGIIFFLSWALSPLAGPVRKLVDAVQRRIGAGR